MSVARSATQLESYLHEAAASACNGADFGDSEYLQPLRILLQSLEADTPLHDCPGCEIEPLLIRLLISRCYSERGWRSEQGIRQQSMAAPLFIVGLPRTGTTVLQRLLAVDPQFQGLESWLIHTPMVRPPRSQWESIPEFELTQWITEERYRRTPQLAAVHFSAASEYEDCCLLLAQNFMTEWFSLIAPVHSYTRWLEQADFRTTYLRYADNLKLIGAADPTRRWLLKDPLHTWHLDALLDTFPQARIVFMHRDPVAVIASTCSLLTKTGTTKFFSDSKSPGPRVCAYWRRALERGLSVRDQRPSHFYDFSYVAFMQDPLSSIRKLYRHFDLELRPKVMAEMGEWLAENTQGRHGSHCYTLANYGLHEHLIREQYADYIERFGL